MNILFRCDGSNEIGMGHISRCLTLASSFSKRDHQIHFAIRKSNLAIKKVSESFNVIKSNEVKFDYEEWLGDCLKRMKIDFLIFDSRDKFSPSSLKRLKNENEIKVVTIDDPEEKRYEADLALFPPVPQTKKFLKNKFKGKVLVGWEYVIVNDRFLKSYQKPHNMKFTILVTMGGSDKENMTEFVIESLNKLKTNFFLKIVIGPGYKDLERLKTTLNKCTYDYELFVDPNNLPEIMSSTDFAIAAFGVTAYELLALNIPAIYLCISDDHVESAKLFESSKVACLAGKFSNLKKEDLINNIKKTIDKKKLNKMIKKAKLVNMKKNNRRIVKIIEGAL